MATNVDAVTEQSKTIYKFFCRFILLSALGVLVLLGLLAIFLL